MNIEKTKQIIMKVSEVRAEEYLRNLEIEKSKISKLDDLYTILKEINSFSWKDSEKLSLIASILKTTFVSSDFIKGSEFTSKRNGELESSLLVLRNNLIEISFDFDGDMLYIKRKNGIKTFPKPIYNPKYDEFIIFHDNYKSSKSKEERKILVDIYMAINNIKPNFLGTTKVKDEELDKVREKIDLDIEIFYSTLKSWTKNQNDLYIEQKEDLMLLDDLSPLIEFFTDNGWVIKKNIYSIKEVF